YDKKVLTPKSFEKKYGFNKNAIGNDNIRKVLFKSCGNSWPELSVQGYNDKLYIQPYVTYEEEKDSTKNIVIFANGSLKGNWYANYFFSEKQNKWYHIQGGSSATSFKTADMVESAIERNADNKWTPVPG
ncbi:MAG: hypothetical protein RR606_08650, partial [Oscillospiraceae bacterium]